MSFIEALGWAAGWIIGPIVVLPVLIILTLALWVNAAEAFDYRGAGEGLLWRIDAGA